MPEPRCAYFVADAHLGQGSSDSNRGRERDLLRLFDLVLSERAALYVVGDLFDFWFEYGHTVPKRYVAVLQRLGELRRAGLPVTYVGGNHDFWIGDYLRRELDVAFTDAPLPLTIQGRRILLAHGDGMGPGDRGYKLLKRVLRNRLSRWLFRWIHPDIGIPLATMTSRTSRDHAPRVKRSEGWLLETLARPVFHDGFDALVLAHFHIPVHRRESDGELVVLGDWIERRTYARLEGGVFRLEDFRDGPAS
ncbi:MAG: UDP-2,3-diacylglucosamine diphosphatase [Candidatus Eisenbacteria bacterium]|uniref:UDP-2,3-diacylglucosamine diphosphatase n=1 Tax=Eiseniibacteriota bacterium TaxID=2212470 RepID=A0A538TB60_UNCEI|nr:MAG: UDP-2,3-diacylglucosamine diphosphatase [Candidatus Eisenbacteria bacterium]